MAHQFNLAGADEGVRSMLLLINSKEPGFKDAVKNAFKVLYLQNENSNEYESAVEVNKIHRRIFCLLFLLMRDRSFRLSIN